MFAISTPSTTPSAVPSVSARPGSSVCTCTLSAVESPTTSSESPISSSCALERVLVERLALDDEDGAVAVLGELLVDRVEAERLRLDRHVRELLARRAVDHPARDLDEAGAAGVDDARVAQDVEHLGRAREGVLAAREHGAQQLVGRSAACSFLLALLGHLADDREHRPLDGRFTARYAVSLAPRNARLRSSAELTPSCSPSTSTKPRTICEKMTPEFPRAPMSAARVTSFATASLSAARRGVERLDDRAERQDEVRARVAVRAPDRR